MESFWGSDAQTAVFLPRTARPEPGFLKLTRLVGSHQRQQPPPEAVE